MNKKTYKLFRTFIIILIAAVVAMVISMGNLILGLVFIFLGSLALYLARRNLEEITEDERTAHVASYASRMAILTFLIIITVVGISLLALKSYFPEYKQAGLTLVNASCLLIIIHGLFYVYYGRKFG
jgi:uncharacterized membrane protein